MKSLLRSPLKTLLTLLLLSSAAFHILPRNNWKAAGC